MIEEVKKKLLLENGFSEEEIQEAENTREVVFEICRQYDRTAANAKKMIHMHNLETIPFGIVCSIFLGDQVLFQQVQGWPTVATRACKSIASVIEEHK